MELEAARHNRVPQAGTQHGTQQGGGGALTPSEEAWRTFSIGPAASLHSPATPCSAFWLGTRCRADVFAGGAVLFNESCAYKTWAVSACTGFEKAYRYISSAPHACRVDSCDQHQSEKMPELAAIDVQNLCFTCSCVVSRRRDPSLAILKIMAHCKSGMHAVARSRLAHLCCFCFSLGVPLLLLLCLDRSSSSSPRPLRVHRSCLHAGSHHLHRTT